MEAALEPLLRAATAFRLGREAAGNRAYVELVDRLLAAPPATAAAIAPLLPELIAAQSRGDCARLADLLLFELAPRLRP